MNLSIAMSMMVVFIGAALSSIPIHGPHLISFPDMETMLQYVAGLFALAMSALCQAGRLSFQEMVLASFQRVGPMQFACFSSILATTIITVAAVFAQALPGYDKGCQVTYPAHLCCL